MDKVPTDFVYIGIALGILYTSTRLMKAGASHIFALMVAYGIITRLKEISTNDTLSINEEIDYRLEILGAPSHFHLDTNLINLFFSIYGWRERNPNNFDNAIKAVNNVLKISEDTEHVLQRCVDNYEIAYDQSKIAMNMIHGFTYSIDQPLLVTKLKKVLIRLHMLLERHIRQIQKNCEITEGKKKSIDVNSRFIEDAHGPKPFDGSSMTQFDYY